MYSFSPNLPSSHRTPSKAVDSSKSPDPSRTLNAVVDSVVQAFQSSTSRFGQTAADEALEEFWRMKLSGMPSQARARLHNAFGGTFYGLTPDDPVISYEYQTVRNENLDRDDEEDMSFDHLGGRLDRNRQPLQVCFCVLPGGSCFATKKDCVSRTDARRNAAQFALLNSLLNEHPSRKITPEHAQSIVFEMENSVSSSFRRSSHVEGLRSVLEFMTGKTFLEYVEFCNVLHLTAWAGSLRSFVNEGSTREEALQQCFESRVDEDLRWQLAQEILQKESESSGFINEQMQIALDEVEHLRSVGKELRFALEKSRVCKLALRELQSDFHH